MVKPELVLSNTTSFFTGAISTVFRNAKKYGFKYVEIVPYRWTTPEQIAALETKYGVAVAGIHMSTWWNKSMKEVLAERPGLSEKLLALVFSAYLGDGAKNPGLAIAEALEDKKPYVLFHTITVSHLKEEFEKLTSRFHVVTENVPREPGYPQWFWDPIIAKATLERRGLAGLVFDPGHFGETLRVMTHLNTLEAYKKSQPEIIHISYNSRIRHLLPNKQEQEELKQMLQAHVPRYIVIETNPFVSIKKGKELLDKIIAEALS